MEKITRNMDSYEKFAMDYYGWLSESDFFSSVPQSDIMEILVALAKDSIGLECIDNLRLSNTSPEQLKQYNIIKNSGCCGTHDNKLKCSSGNSYYYGFNFGH